MELAKFTLCPFLFVSLESFPKERALSSPSIVQKLSLLHLIYKNLLEQYLCITYMIKLTFTKIMMNLVFYYRIVFYYCIVYMARAHTFLSQNLIF